MIPDSFLVVLTLFLISIASLGWRHHRRHGFCNHNLVIAFGDSITYGMGIPESENYVSVLSRKLKMQIINMGVPGDTTSDALERIERDVLYLHPKIVIVFLGGNDFLLPIVQYRQDAAMKNLEILRGERKLPSISPTDTFKNLEKIIDLLHKNGIKIVLVGVSTSYLDDFNEEFLKLARDQSVEAFVPNVLEDIFFNKRNLVLETTPIVHPNIEGHKMIAHRIQPALEKVLKMVDSEASVTENAPIAQSGRAAPF